MTQNKNTRNDTQKRQPRNRSPQKSHPQNRFSRNIRRQLIIRLLLIAAFVLCIYKCFQKISEFWKQANSVYAQNDDTSINDQSEYFTDAPSFENSSIHTETDFLQENPDSDSVHTNTADSYCISLVGISQDGIPTGCESVSTVSVLRYWNIDITPDTFILEYLPCQGFWMEDGITYGPDPNEYFAGDPYESASLGCYANVIIKALESLQEQNYPGTKNLRFSEATGMTLSDLSKNYVSNGIPVIVWVTMDMKAPYDGMEYYLEDGTSYVWIAREHCMVLCGYNEQNYYLMDPLADGTIVSYEKELCEQRFAELGQQAIVMAK